MFRAQPEPEIKGCCRPKTTGILYATPSDACRGVREKVLFVTCPSISEPRRPDALMTVDVNPQSKTYCQILCKLEFPNIGDEIHHTGWVCKFGLFVIKMLFRMHVQVVMGRQI
jgi:hypothetical protein